jgi:hypothetical protein
MNPYGLLNGRYPAVVASYDAQARQCRVKIDGITDGMEAMPLAEIEYPIGDKSRAGANTTELEILAGDTVWVSFMCGDSRYPIITGYRNPNTGNSTNWRRIHHANIEQLADALIKLIAGGDFLIQSGSSVTVKAPSVTIDAANTTITGNCAISGALAVSGATTSAGGIKGAGGLSFEGHKHTSSSSGSDTSTPH